MKRHSATRDAGFLHWVFPAMLGVVALGALLSGRDLSQTFMDLASGGGVQHPLVPWAQRLASVVLLAASAERILRHFTQHKPMPSPLLATVFVTFWLTTVAAPAFLGANRQISHEYLYPLIFGVAALLVTVPERDRVLDASRNALFLFMLVGMLLIPVMPALVMDTTYQQGLIPGLPRFGGLAPHAVAMGMFAQIALLCLWCRPFRHRWLNRAAWLLGLGVLFIAQSKTAWIAMLLCVICMFAVRQAPGIWRRLGDPREGAFGALACMGIIFLSLALMGVLLLGDIGNRWEDFSGTSEGAQLMTMTGRDQIWAVAMEEWHANPVFGYGPGLWNEEFRASINLPNATNAHNQFLDTLARSGTVGAIGLVLYAAVLLVMSVRYARATGGLSLALFVSLALLSISEVPLILFGYGTELFAHLLLIIVLASAASEHVRVPAPRARPAYRTAS